MLVEVYRPRADLVSILGYSPNGSAKGGLLAVGVAGGLSTEASSARALADHGASVRRERVRQEPRIWRLKRVIGPDGRSLTLADLPPTNLKHWLPYHKARIVTTVRGGLISADQVCERYQLTLEELKTWERAFECHGIDGLRACRISRSPRHAQ